MNSLTYDHVELHGIDEMLIAPGRTMAVTDTCNEVAKSQAVRLWDVFFLAPFMIWLGARSGTIPTWAKYTLIAGGAATAYYNAANFMATREANQ